jgi:diacylglycerol kinase (ATP)
MRRGVVASAAVNDAKPLVIVNPRARGRLSEKEWARAVGALTDGLGPLDVRFTERAGHAREIAREEAAAGRKLLVACGGDGTISEVSDGVLASGRGREVDIALIPRGTGGDLRRTLESPEDVAAAALHVRQAAAHVIDVGKVVFVAHDGQPATAHFINAASFGFSADVGRRANLSSKRLGAKVAFLGAALSSLVSFDNVDVLVSVDGEEPRRRTFLLGAMGNGRFFGGGMKICPDARLDDGLLDVVLVGDLGRLEVLSKIGRLYEGTHVALPQVETRRARKVEARPADADASVPIELDGETPGRLPATFEIVPGALRLRF